MKTATFFLTALSLFLLADDEMTTKPMDTKPVDTSLFDARGMDVRSFTKETTIQAPVSTVYAAWSDGDVFPRVYGPDRPELAANIDLAIGGRYEWLWDGEMGSNGCQVLSYLFLTIYRLFLRITVGCVAES